MAAYRAFNRKAGVYVYWLGCTKTKMAMQRRLKQYGAPKHVAPKKVAKCIRDE